MAQPFFLFTPAIDTTTTTTRRRRTTTSPWRRLPTLIFRSFRPLEKKSPFPRRVFQYFVTSSLLSFCPEHPSTLTNGLPRSLFLLGREKPLRPDNNAPRFGVKEAELSACLPARAGWSWRGSLNQSPGYVSPSRLPPSHD